MSPLNGKEIFPDKLLRQIQKYVSDQTVYIPAKEKRKSWGEKSGSKKYIFERNREIKQKFRNGTSIDALSDQYFLSIESIKRIVYSKKEEHRMNLKSTSPSITDFSAKEKCTELSNGEKFQIREDALIGHCGTDSVITIPEEIHTINQSAFANRTATEKIIIPDHVYLIGYSAFQGCKSLSSITLPSQLRDLGCNTFRDCTALQEISIPDSVTLIGYSAFHGCKNLSAITIPTGVVSIGRGVFNGCEKLTSITYNGTRAQWEMISKAPQWDLGMPRYTVQCIDGVLNG